jgi:phospholipase C
MVKWRLVVATFTMISVVSACGESNDPLFTAAATPSCAFQAGALPAETLPESAPRGEQIPIEHIIVLMQENRSFDSYFGRLPASGHPDVDGLPAGASNPDAVGTPVAAFHQTRYCTADTNHEWTGSHEEFDDGKNDGLPRLSRLATGTSVPCSARPTPTGSTC